MSRRNPNPCGTNYGQLRHIRRGEPICDECRAAHNAYDRERRRRNGAVPMDQYGIGEVHGTYAAYYRHRRAGEPACDLCLKGASIYVKDRRIKTGVQKGRRGPTYDEWVDGLLGEK